MKPKAPTNSSDTSGLSAFETELVWIPFSNVLHDYTRSNYAFIHHIEIQMENLIKKSKISSKNELHLKPMNKVQRAIVHELSEHYDIESTSHDYDPKRYVVRNISHTYY